MSTSKYYQNELENLRDLASEFAQEHPTLAPHLASSSTDPDVERILEGTAFLTASIRQKIDDDFPEFAQGLLKHIFPHYLKALPCATILKFSPKSILKNKIEIKAGTCVDSVNVDEVSCRFQTIKPIHVLPLSIVDAAFNETSTGKKVLNLSFELDGLNNANCDIDDIELYLSGGFHVASDLLFLLHNRVDSIDISSTENNAIHAIQCEIEGGGFQDEDALLKYPSNAFPAYRLIQEYFLLKEKFLFFKIKNLKNIIKSLSGTKFKIKFILKDNLPQLPRINQNNFVLHAVPAINLFTHDAVSIQNDFKQFEYHVKPVRNDKSQFHIHSVNSVIGLNRKTTTRTEYQLAGLSDPDTNDRAVFQINTRLSANSSESYISFSYPSSMALDHKEVVQLKLSCSNGMLPSKLREGDINKATDSTSAMVDFTNLIRPSEFQMSPTGQSLSWRLLSHLSLNYLSLADTENLKSLLSLYIFSSDSGSKQASINRKRIDGIESVSVESCDRLVRGVPMRGQIIKVSINANNFSSKGDMYLFGLLLNYLFSSFASLNSFTELTLTDTNSDETYHFNAKSGVKSLI